MSANFTPDMTGYKGLSPFRFWCQKTLPLVYDDSLSYYELLCKVVSYINNLITDVAAAEENVDKLLTAYNQLQEYVNNYFDGEDFQQKIDDSLDRYAEDGTLSRMVNTHVSALLPYEVGQQIGPVVDEDLGPVVDLKLPAVVESKIAAPVATQLPAVVQTQIGGVVGNQIGDVVADQIDEVVADQITDAVSPLVHDEVTGLIRPAVATELPAALQVYLPPEVQTQLPGAIGTDLETIAPPVIEDWLDAHPEATTSVPDGSISFSKLATDLQRRAGIVGTYFPSDFTNEYAWQVNQYAVYQGIVYRCIKTTTAGQAWNASEWTTANMNSDLFYMWWCLNYLSQSITTIDSSPATSAHEAGEYFIYYDGVHLYRLAKASSNIAVGDTLTPNGNFIYSSVANMIADLKVEIADLKSAFVKREIPIEDAEPNTTVSSQNGVVSSNNTYSMVSFDVIPSSKLVYTTGHNENAAGIAFYDNNGVFISGNAAINGTQNITIPQTAYSAKACYRTAEVSSFKIKILEYVCDIVSHINNAEYTAESLEKVLITNRYLTSTWVHGSVKSTTGADSGSATYARSDFIKIMPNVEKSIKAILTQGSYSNNLNCYIYIYNSNTVDSFTGNIIPLNIGTTDITRHLTEGQYIRCVVRDGSTEINLQTVSSIFSIQYDTIKTDKTLKLPNYPADAQAVGDALKDTDYAYAMTSVLCIGDSLTRGSSPIEDWGVTTGTVPIYQNYPYMLGRMIRCDVENAGFSGISASTWYQNWADTVTPTEDKPYKVPHYDFADYDTVIIWLGTNNGFDPDDLDTEGTEANYYCKIIDAIQAGYTAGHTDERYSDHGLIVLAKVFATKSGYNLSDTNAAIDAIATRYGLPVIDNSDLSPSKHPELHENVDNPHFGKSGYIYIANRFCKEISEWLSQNPTRADFGETQFPFTE